MLAERFAAALPARARIADLGAGDGANMRYLAPLLPDARWRLVDDDIALLEATRAETLRLDLARDLEHIGDVDAVTCSALLDLVSEDWLRRLVRWLGGRPFLAALSVDGRVAFAPEDEEDARVLAAFARDQGRDKGFGPALGAAAPDRLAALLQAAGYATAVADSDWQLGPGDAPVLHDMIEGFAAIAPDARAWSERRRAQSARGALRLVVGHRDVLGARC
jgi:trans-aconitate methyltransferase